MKIKHELWQAALVITWGIEIDDIKCGNCLHYKNYGKFIHDGKYHSPCICPEPCAPGVNGSRIDALPMVQIDDQCPGFYPAQIIVENPEAWTPYEY